MEDPFPPRCRSAFKPVRALAAGGYGAVWLADQIALERPAVVKLLHAHVLDDATSVARFTEEARITAALAHPCVVVLLDHAVEDGIPWIAYEYLAGPDLRDRMAAGPLPIGTAVAAARDVAAALEAAHARGVLHRDVKPENVFSAGGDRFKLGDFGVAKWGTAVHTKTGLLMGTASYMAPEHIRGDPVDGRLDQYALGVMLYELLTGRLPYQGAVLEVLEAHMQAPPPNPRALRPEVPPELAAIVARAMAKDPGDRFPDAGALRAALSSLSLARGPARTRPAARPAAPPRLSSGATRAKRRTQAAAVALGMLVAIGLALRPAPAPAPRGTVRAAVDALAAPSAADPRITPGPPASAIVDPARAAIAAVVLELGNMRLAQTESTGHDKPSDELVHRAVGSRKSRERLCGMFNRLVAVHDATPVGRRAALWREDAGNAGLARGFLYVGEDLESVDPPYRTRDGVAGRFFRRVLEEPEPNPLAALAYARWLLQAYSGLVNATPRDASVRLAGHALALVAAAAACAPGRPADEAVIALLLVSFPRDSWEPGETDRGDTQKIWHSWRTLLMHCGEWHAGEFRPKGPLGPLVLHLRWRQFGAHQQLFDQLYASALFGRVASSLAELGGIWVPLITHLRTLRLEDQRAREAEALYKRLSAVPNAPRYRALFADLRAVDEAAHAVVPGGPATPQAAAALADALEEALETTARAGEDVGPADVMLALQGCAGADALGTFAGSELARRLGREQLAGAMGLARAYRALFLTRARAAWPAVVAACPDEPNACAVAGRYLETLAPAAVAAARGVEGRAAAVLARVR